MSEEKLEQLEQLVNAVLDELKLFEGELLKVMPAMYQMIIQNALLLELIYEYLSKNDKDALTEIDRLYNKYITMIVKQMTGREVGVKEKKEQKLRVQQDKDDDTTFKLN